MKTTKKFLSVLLSVVMVVTTMSVAFVAFAPPVYAAPTAADYDALANAIRALRTNDANPTNAVLDVDGTSASYSDATGDMIAVAEKYYTVFSGLKPTGTINQNTSSNRTATMINATIKNQMQSRFTSDELSGWAIVALLDSLIANQDINGATNNSSAPAAPTITVTVTDANGLLDYDDVDGLPDTIVGSYTYTYAHSTGSYTQNCSDRYYVKIGNVTRTTGDVIETAPIKTLKTKITNYADYYDYDFATLVATDTDTLETVKADLSAAYNAVINSTTYDGAAVYAHFFTADTAGLLAQIDAAIAIATYIGIAQELQSFTETDITEYTFDELSDFYFEFKGKRDNYNEAASAATKAFLEENGYIDMDAVNAKFEEIENAYEIAYLRDTVKPRLEADLATYAAYDDDWTIATDGVEGILAADELEINYIIGEIASKKTANVEAVFGEGYDINEVFAPVLENFAHIREVNGYNLTFKNYQNVYNNVFAPLTLEETDAQLLNILNQRDAWYTQLQEFAAQLAEYDEEIAAKILTDAEAAMEDKIARTYAALNAILEGQINDAWAIYQTQADEQGLLINEVNMATYNTLMQSVGLINASAYDFLAETEHFDLSEETVEKYEALKNIVIALNNYDPSKTLSAYKYNAETLDPIVRYVNDGDIIRDRDYVVTDEYLNNLVELLNGLLKDGFPEELGLDLDLAATLDGIWDTLYTDKTVNTLMGALYPTLAGLVRDKLNELIGDFLSMLPDLDDAFMKLDVGVSPKKVGALVDATKYPDIAAVLKGVTGSDSGFMYGNSDDDTNCWNSAEAMAELYRDAVDEEGNPVLDDDGNPTKELKFDWGVDAKETMEEKKEAFLQAIDSAFKALQPVFFGLLCDKSVARKQIASVLLGAVTINVGIIGNDGYNNALAPIFEALGVREGIMTDAKTYTNVRDIFEYGLFDPLADLLDQLKANPAEKILDLLPNLAFAIQNNLFLDLLHKLVIELDVKGGGLGGSCIDSQLPSDGVRVDLGEELDLADLLGIETFYEDILSMDGVLSVVLSLLAGDEEEEAEEPAEGEEPATATDATPTDAAPAPELKLPHMDGAKLAMLGTDVVWADSFRSHSQITYEGRKNIHANIIANRPQVMQFLLEYILEALKDEDFIPAILNMINKDKAEDEQVTLPDAVNEILANVNASGTDAVAAIYELVHPVYRYTMPPAIDWITEGTINETDYANYWTDVSTEGKETLWTKAKAVYMAEHLGNFLDDIVLIFGDQLGGAQTLGQAVDYLLGNLFKASTLNDLAASLKDLLGGLELPEAIADMGLLESAGLDLTAWDDMTFDFADGDRAAFKAGLIELLDPIAPLLGFLLAEQDISLNLLDLIDVTAVGYNGYAYGLVPLMEALGCKKSAIKSPAAFIADSGNVVKNLIDPVFSLIDKLEDNPLVFIEDLIPSLLYFDKVGGIQVAIEHLLTAVHVLLDIIRPIYDVDLYAVVAEQFGIDLHFAETDPINFLLMKIGELIEENTDITLQIDFTVESLSAELNFTDPIKFTSANGDPAYTIKLTEDGKADLVTRVLDFGLEELVFADNVANLEKLLKDVVTDEGLLSMLTTLLENLKMLDEDVDDFHGIKDVALATVFWVFFGADSVTDADADFFHRFNKDEDSYIDFLLMALDSSVPYMERFGFIAEEIIKVEYPALMQTLENARSLKDKNPFDYTPEEVHYVSGILARIISFILHLIAYLKVTRGA